MKKVLVTGAAGAIGLQTIKFLLSEGKYEITALDLRTKNNYKKLKRYRRRINIIYGDINDQVLIEALVKDQDYIIHLASVLPPFADIKKDLSEKIEYLGTENIIKALNFYNPECFMIYASSTTIYGNIEKASVKTKPNLTEIDYYSNIKLKTEELIQKKIKNYTIIRLPLVLCNPKTEAFMYNVKKNSVVEAITANDAAYLFANSLNHSEKLNKKIWNAGGGEQLTAPYREILANVLAIYGLSFKYILNRLFIDKNFYVSTYEDSDKLNEIIDYRSDSLSSYYMRLKRTTKKRRAINRFLAKPFVFFLKRNKVKLEKTKLKKEKLGKEKLEKEIRKKDNK